MLTQREQTPKPPPKEAAQDAKEQKEFDRRIAKSLAQALFRALSPGEFERLIKALKQSEGEMQFESLQQQAPGPAGIRNDSQALPQYRQYDHTPHRRERPGPAATKGGATMPQGLNVIEFRGHNYPDRCSHCLATIESTAIVLLNTSLIFCNEDCVTGFIGSRTANITIREERTVQCMVS